MRYLGVCALVVALLIGSLECQTAFAGGGGTKANATIEVKNVDGAATIGVIVDPPAGFNPTSLDEFKAAGGKILGPGKTGSFRVVAGRHTVAAGEVTNNGYVFIGAMDVTAAKHKTTKLVVDTTGLNFK